MGELEQALFWMQEAKRYQPLFGRNLYHLTLVSFEMRQYKQSLDYVSQLVKLRHQPFKKTVGLAVHIALVAKDYQTAANFSIMYLNKWSDNPIIEEAEYRLRNGIEVESIKELFVYNYESI
jgi:hypothetical protein